MVPYQFTTQNCWVSDLNIQKAEIILETLTFQSGFDVDGAVVGIFVFKEQIECSS